jgi:hypothetical protein
VRCRFLHVSKRDAGVEGGGDEGAAQRVGPIFLASPARRATRRTICGAALFTARLARHYLDPVPNVAELSTQP